MADTTDWCNLIKVYAGMEDMKERDLSILRATIWVLNTSDATLAERKRALYEMNTAWNFLRDARIGIPADLQAVHDELHMFVELAEHHMPGATQDVLRETARQVVNKPNPGKPAATAVKSM